MRPRDSQDDTLFRLIGDPANWEFPSRDHATYADMGVTVDYDGTFWNVGMGGTKVFAVPDSGRAIDAAYVIAQIPTFLAVEVFPDDPKTPRVLRMGDHVVQLDVEENSR